MRWSTSAALALAIAAEACSAGETSIGTVVVDSGSPDDGAEVFVEDATPETSPDATTDGDPGDAEADTLDDAETDTGIDVGPSCAVTPIGRSCTTTQPCPDPYICFGHGETGFCATPEPECGGFLDKKCPEGRLCLRASGSSLGYCATAEELPCICKPDAEKIDGCSP